MAKLINAPYAKQQDSTGQSLVTICIGTQAQTIAKHFNEMGKSAAEIELTYNWGVDKYEQGTAYGHIAIGVDDIYATCEAVRASGGNVTREAGPVKGGSTVIAFVEDPDGYKIEFIENKSTKSGLGN